MTNDYYYVYMHVNTINQKKYIGLTSKIPSKRWGKNGSGYRYNKQPAFNRAIEKYGWDSFEHVVLFEGLSKEEACEKEIEYIEKYKTQDPEFGYNIQPGGQLGNLGLEFSEETKQKISDAHKGKKLSEEHKRKISESCKGHKPGHHTEEGLRRLREFNTGKIMSEETKKKISESLTGIKRSPETLQKRKDHSSKNVAVYCPELDMSFQTICDASKYSGVPSSNIQKCLKGERKTAGKHSSSGAPLHWRKVENNS